MSRSGYTIDPEEARSRRASRIQSRESSVVPVEELGNKSNRNRNFWVDIVNHERLILIINVGTFKFKDQCLIPHIKLFLQGITIKESKRNLFYPYIRHLRNIEINAIDSEISSRIVLSLLYISFLDAYIVNADSKKFLSFLCNACGGGKSGVSGSGQQY